MQNRDLLRASLRLVGYLVLDTVVGAIIGVLLLTVLDVYLYVEHYILFGVPVEFQISYDQVPWSALIGAIGWFAAAFVCQIRFAVGEALGCRTLGLNTVVGAAAGAVLWLVAMCIDPVSREALLFGPLEELMFGLGLGALPLSIIGAIAAFSVTLINMMRARRGAGPGSWTAHLGDTTCPTGQSEDRN